MPTLEFVINIVTIIGSILGIIVTARVIYEQITARKRKEELIKTVREAVKREKLYLDWDCEVNIQNFEGHTEETNTVTLVNLKENRVKKTWHHIWGDESFFKSLKFDAYDSEGNRLDIIPITREPSHMRVSVKFRDYVKPLKPYKYKWIQKYRQFRDLQRGEWFEFQQDSLIKDLNIRILFPPNSVLTSEPVYCYTIEDGDMVPFAQLEAKRRGNRQYVELKIGELGANKILRFKFSAEPI